MTFAVLTYTAVEKYISVFAIKISTIYLFVQYVSTRTYNAPLAFFVRIYFMKRIYYEKLN